MFTNAVLVELAQLWERFLSAPPEGLAIVAVLAVRLTQKSVVLRHHSVYRGGLALGGLLALLHCVLVFLGFVTTSDDSFFTIIRALSLGGLLAASLWCLAVPFDLLGNLLRQLLHTGGTLWSMPLRWFKVTRQQRRAFQQQQTLEHEANRRRQEETTRTAQEQRVHQQRRAVRRQLEVYRLRHSTVLEANYPSAAFEQLLQLLFDSNLPWEQGEREAAELLHEMQNVVAGSDSVTPVDPVTALVNDYERRRKEIQTMATDDEVKETILYQLKLTFLTQLQEQVTKS